jgi:hypothetical protein
MSDITSSLFSALDGNNTVNTQAAGSPQFSSTYGSSDVTFQSFSLYIEGVQVPFQSISVSSGMNELPSAVLYMPPLAGIGDIARYYQPKVHIFFEDPVTHDDRLLFSGVITGNGYSKSANGQSSMMFQCRHRYSLIEGMVLRYGGFIAEAGDITNNANGETVVPTLNSKQSVEQALRGLLGTNPATEVTPANVTANKADPATLPSELAAYKTRLSGFAGVLVNFWNQLKMGAYGDTESYEIFLKLYEPLLEEGLQFFKRLSGHPFLEQLLEQDRVDPCPDDSGNPNSRKALIPPSMKLFTQMAVQHSFAVANLQSFGQVVQEQTGLWTLLDSFFSTIDYQILTLASPAEAASGPIETVVKPELPFYYSPRCNVLYPHMYYDISTQEADENLPTRVALVNYSIPGQTNMGTTYHAPASIREASARDPKTGNLVGDLSTTTKSLHLNIGKYEQGRGIHTQKLAMPSWLAYFNQGQADNAPSASELPPDEGEAANLALLKQAWEARYGADADKMNPWSDTSNIKPYERILFAAADYQYTQEIAKSRAGTVTAVFNPYITPGYSMDILNASPGEPSYHGYCAGITHTITPGNISTQVSFVAAMSYTELANYYLQFVHPWMQTALNITSQTPDGITTSIVMNPQAKASADQFFGDVLGVPAAAPDEIYDFDTGEIMPFNDQISGSVEKLPGFEANPTESTVGNLSLVRRPIETKDSVAASFNIKFIDMAEDNYNPSVITYTDQALVDSDLMEPGQSIFLNYADVPKG